MVENIFEPCCATALNSNLLSCKILTVFKAVVAVEVLFVAININVVNKKLIKIKSFIII